MGWYQRRVHGPAVAAKATPAVAAKATPAVAKCSDREPPKDQKWKFPTCALQLSKIPENCAKRRSGALKDGFCSKTCGVCGAKKTGKAAGKKTGKAAGKKTGKAGLVAAVKKNGKAPVVAAVKNAAKKNAANAKAAVAKCTDLAPPKADKWKNPTCALQLSKTKNCAARKAGTMKDGYCSKTCGVCGAKKTGKAA